MLEKTINMNAHLRCPGKCNLVWRSEYSKIPWNCLGIKMPHGCKSGMNKLECNRIMDSTTLHNMQYFECEKRHPNCMRFCVPCVLYYGQVNQKILPQSYQVSKEIADMRPKYPFDDIPESAVASLKTIVIE